MPGILIYNAASGTAEKFPPSRLLAELPVGTRLHELAEGDDPEAVARKIIAEGVPWIAVAGGDGTVEAVARTLIGSAVTLGIIPCGTYNNFARSAGLPPNPLEAAHVIAAGATRDVDVGIVNGMPFFECVGAGLDAALFPMGEEIKSGAFTKWPDFLRRAFVYPRQTFDLELDRPVSEALVGSISSSRRSIRRWRTSRRAHLRVRALMITVSNGPYYGMNFAIAPDATIDDGNFTVTIFKYYSKFELWWHYIAIRMGRRVYTPKTVVLKLGRLKISGPRRLAAHADGTPLDQWPLDLSVQRAVLRIFSALNNG